MVQARGAGVGMLRSCPRNLIILLAGSCLLGCGLFRTEGEEEGIPRIEVAVFDGGFGIAWHRGRVEEFLAWRKEQGRPLLAHFWGDPRVIDKLRPRVLRRDPPDTSDAVMPFWKMVVSDILLPMDPWLDSPAVGNASETWRQTFLPGALTPFLYKDQVYGIPLVFNSWLIWYDRTLFDQNGWEPPKTWTEWEQLCDKIRAKGIAPITYQGKYPLYSQGLFWQTCQRWAGDRVVQRCQNFEPGAFLDPKVIESAKILQDFTRKYFQDGCMAMSHTEAQMEFVNRRAAMIPCGLWLENEMRDAFPDDFVPGCFSIPPIEGGKGDPRAAFATGTQAFYTYRDGGSPEDAAELLKFMLSRESQEKWVDTVSTVSSIRGATQRDKITPGLTDALDIIEGASYTFDDRLIELFPTWRVEVWLPTLEGLIAGRVTPENLARIAEDGLERVRQNPEIFKPPPRPLPPGVGENAG